MQNSLTDVWTCLAMYGHVSQCMDMYPKVWTCITMYGYVSYGHVLLSVAMLHNVWTRITMYGHVLQCMDMYHNAWTCITMYGHVSQCKDMYRNRSVSQTSLLDMLPTSSASLKMCRHLANLHKKMKLSECAS